MRNVRVLHDVTLGVGQEPKCISTEIDSNR